MSLDARINENYKKLNSNDLHVLHFIKSDMKSGADLNIAELATKCNVSAASIMRMTKKLNFSGFSEFKYFIRNEMKGKTNIKVRDTLKELSYDFQQTIKVFQQNNLTSTLYEMIDRADHLYAYGTGHGQRLMLNEFARCLLNVNKYLIVLPAFTELDLASNNFTENDLLFIASLSGSISFLKETILNLDIRRVPIISITNLNNNELASFTKYNFYFQSSNINKESNLNQSSYLSLHLLLHLLYEGYVDYLIERNEKEI